MRLFLKLLPVAVALFTFGIGKAAPVPKVKENTMGLTASVTFEKKRR